METPIIDHLFRHQSGKMVSILTKIFGFEHLQTIEDAVQDTFVKATHAWSKEMPDNPEAWLTAAAKNRVIDIFRSLSAEKARSTIFHNKIQTLHLQDLFLDSEVQDSQLRMIFAACHPELDSRSQLAFALKTISGFNTKEIAAALLSKQETIKKRLQRARQKIVADQIAFEIPSGPDLLPRLKRVLEVIYVIFNEGFNPNKKDKAIRKELCGEALRLCKLLLSKSELRTADSYALLALMCFHSSRLDSRINADDELIPLSEQDRSQWYFPLMTLGNDAMNTAVNMTETFSSYHYEAAIAAEHLKAPDFKSTDWNAIANWYEQLNILHPSPLTQLNMAVVYLQAQKIEQAYSLLQQIDASTLEQKKYIYYATLAEYYKVRGEMSEARSHLDQAISLATNNSQKQFLKSKKSKYK